jgi:DNA-binding MarR family transcriptional regulator
MAASSPSGDDHDFSAADAREFSRLLELLVKTELRSGEISRQGAVARHGHEAGRRAPMVAKARAVFFERKRRSQYFSPVMFGEAGWDLLLALYIADFAGTQQTIGNLVSSIGEPPTSALRWVDYLEKERLISRRPSPRDRRAVIVEITDKARSKLDDYFAALPFPLSGEA